MTRPRDTTDCAIRIWVDDVGDEIITALMPHAIDIEPKRRKADIRYLRRVAKWINKTADWLETLVENDR